MFGSTEIISNTILAGILGGALIGAGTVHCMSSARRMEERFANLEKNLNEAESNLERLVTHELKQKERLDKINHDLSAIVNIINQEINNANQQQTKP